MTFEIIMIASAGVLLPILLYYETRENRSGILPVKAALSALFVITAVIEAQATTPYYRALLPGLLLCLCGDIFLALPQEKMFRAGLFSFLIGHIFYIIAFFSTASLNNWTWWGTCMVLIMSGAVYRWLRPHLGKMNLPVLAYIVVITAMVSGAWSIAGDILLTPAGRVAVFSGAGCFYLSDLFVARDRFVKKSPANRLLGLPLYYAGQFLLAFSVGLM